MPRNVDRHQPVSVFLDHYAREIEELLLTILEEKHLYQNCRLTPPEEAVKAFRASCADNSIAQLLHKRHENVMLLGAKGPWEAAGSGEGERLLIPTLDQRDSAAAQPNRQRHLVFDPPPTVRTVCSSCSAAEPHNLDRARQPSPSAVVANEAVQTFAFTYACQACKGPPTLFLVRRQGHRLHICGRSPIEQLVTDNFFPEPRKHLGNAILGFRCGQTLAACALLRVYIEQVAFASEGVPDGQQTIMDVYQAGLPDREREQLPSLRDVYSRLSDAIHTAREDDSVFEAALEDVRLHFQGLDFLRAVRLHSERS